MGNTWVLPAFKQILIDASQEYMDATDRAKDKPRTALVNRVAEEIRQGVNGTDGSLPDELEKVWFILTNYEDQLMTIIGGPNLVRQWGRWLCNRKGREKVQIGYTWPPNFRQVLDIKKCLRKAVRGQDLRGTNTPFRWHREGSGLLWPRFEWGVHRAFRRREGTLWGTGNTVEQGWASGSRAARVGCIQSRLIMFMLNHCTDIRRRFHQTLPSGWSTWRRSLERSFLWFVDTLMRMADLVLQSQSYIFVQVFVEPF